jgi:2-amino-4-hydroxy-6-hydroxymethyldihydropteridine diphosphokinase
MIGWREWEDMGSTDCLIGVGSNLGDREAAIRRAIDELAADPQIKLAAMSDLHETAPVGGPPGQGAFLNGVARIATSLGARELLNMLLAIEAKLGRTREIHWGPRTIDLDLLLYGHQIIDEPDLRVPHPLMHDRRFVLVPAAEIAAEMIHPVLQCTIRDLLARLDGPRTSA